MTTKTLKTRNIGALGLLALLIFSLSGCASAQPACANGEATQVPPRMVTVTGDADVRVAPDEVLITLGVETWDEDLEAAKRENDTRVKQIFAVAKAHKVAAQHIQTDHISIEPRYDDNYDKRNFIGFFVRQTVVITLKDLDQFESLLTEVLGAGANYVHGIQFRTTELRKYKDEARALAIRAAEEKATALAQELGQKIGEPYTIQENQSGWYTWYSSWWGARWGGGMAQNVVQELGNGGTTSDDSIAVGQITVNAKVTVSFELK